jgi:hypothetical protein
MIALRSPLALPVNFAPTLRLNSTFDSMVKLPLDGPDVKMIPIGKKWSPTFWVT